MEAMREAWTDERLDGELARVNDRIDSLHYGLNRIGAGIIAALVGLIATQL
jgi:hypothetical protein